MTSRRARLILLWLWTGCFVGIGTSMMAMRFVDWIGADYLWRSIRLASGAYGPYLGVAWTFYLVNVRDKSRGSNILSSTAFGLGLVATALWNGVLILSIIRVWIGWTNVESLFDDFENVQLMSWLVAPVIALFFGRDLKSQ